MAQRLYDEIKRIIDDTLSSVHTSMPGIITSVGGMTAGVKPTVTFNTADGKSMSYPVLSGCPIVMPMAADGKTGVAFPVKAGDACLIICCESTLSEWQSGNTRASVRHGLSNAICVPCLLKSAPESVSKARIKNAAILFSKKNEVLCGEDEIQIKFKEDTSITINDDGLQGKIKKDTELKIDNQEFSATVGDEEHSVVIQKELAMLRCSDAHILLMETLADLKLNDNVRCMITEEDAALQLDSKRRIHVGSDSVGMYLDNSHWIEVDAQKTHVEGDLEVSGTVTQGG